MNLIEVAWKNQVGLLYSDPSEQQYFWGQFAFYSGLATICVILLGSSVTRLFGWRLGALSTPIVIGLSGLIFFFFLMHNLYIQDKFRMFGHSILAFSVFFGAAQNILSKSIKYSMFDATKEMALIPLDEESKVKGKAAIDIVGGRLGKAGGGLIQQIMFIFIGPVIVIVPYSATIMLLIIFIWILSVLKLNKLFIKVGGMNAWN